MMCAIEGEKISLSKEMLYRTAVVSRCLAEHLNTCTCKSAMRVSAGTPVAIQFAWHSLEGDAVYYFGLEPGHWLGVSHECGLECLCL